MKPRSTDTEKSPLSPISLELQGFIEQNIDSVGELELLLLLHANPNRKWRAIEATSEIRGALDSVKQRLVALERAGLLGSVQELETAYFYQPKDEHKATMVDELVKAYAVRRSRTIELIYSKSSTRARMFADAFNLTKDPHNDDT